MTKKRTKRMLDRLDRCVLRIEKALKQRRVKWKKS
jgi:hypothetical protein